MGATQGCRTHGCVRPLFSKRRCAVCYLSFVWVFPELRTPSLGTDKEILDFIKFMSWPVPTRPRLRLKLSKKDKATIADRCLEAIASTDKGATSGELSDQLGVDHPNVWRRCSELARAGKVRSGGSRVWSTTDRHQTVYFINS